MNNQSLNSADMKKEAEKLIRYQDLPPELEDAVKLVNAKHASAYTRRKWNQGDSGPQGNPLKVILATISAKTCLLVQVSV